MGLISGVSSGPTIQPHFTSSPLVIRIALKIVHFFYDNFALLFFKQSFERNYHNLTHHLFSKKNATPEETNIYLLFQALTNVQDLTSLSKIKKILSTLNNKNYHLILNQALKISQKYKAHLQIINFLEGEIARVKTDQSQNEDFILTPDQSRLSSWIKPAIIASSLLLMGTAIYFAYSSGLINRLFSSISTPQDISSTALSIPCPSPRYSSSNFLFENPSTALTPPPLPNLISHFSEYKSSLANFLRFPTSPNHLLLSPSPYPTFSIIPPDDISANLNFSARLNILDFCANYTRLEEAKPKNFVTEASSFVFENKKEMLFNFFDCKALPKLASWQRPSLYVLLSSLGLFLFFSRRQKQEEADLSDLFFFSKEPSLERVKRSVEKMEDINLLLADQTILNIACLRNWSLQILQYLLSKKPNPNIETMRGYTAIHSAAKNGRLDLLKILIENGANLNAANHHGLSVIHCAVLGDLTYYIDDPTCERPMDYIKTMSSPEMAKGKWFLSPTDKQRLACLQFLIEEKGFDVNAKDHFNATALDYARAANKTEIIQYLTLRKK